MLDLVTGGAFLPHVSCKKITLESNSADSTKTDVTLLLEIYQNKSELLNSSWLNNLAVQGTNFLDSMYIQVVHTTNYKNCKKLLPSNDPLNIDPAITSNSLKQVGNGAVGFSPSPSIPGNVYVAKTQYGDAYLPRGPVSWWEQAPSIHDPIRGGRVFETRLLSADDSFNTALNYTDIPPPIQISNSSLIGNLSSADALYNAVVDGKVREEFINGKEYYVIPFEYKVEAFDENEGDLGFMFYSFLHAPSWIENLTVAGESVNILDYLEFFEDMIIEGPINSEIVFLNGELQQTREAFFLPAGAPWEGSVHLHATGINEAPDGYSGDGGLSGMDFTTTGEVQDAGTPYRGWMAGETHTSEAPKLRLAEVPNNKIVDFRHSLFPEPLDTVLGIGGVHIPGTEPAIPVLNQGTNKIQEFLTPFQKEKRRDFNRDALGRPIDKETEYSKLYVCRDTENNARGLFFINMLELLKNQSGLFPVMFDEQFNLNTEPGALAHAAAQEGILSVLSKSKLLQLKLYRDRVKKHVINTRYENYSNDEMYEEPSQLIGVIGDQEGYQTPNQNFSLAEVSGLDSVSASAVTRYFMFFDKQVSRQTAGLYRYRVELEFKDGTYEFLYELYRDLNNIKILLDEYYDISVSYYTDGNITQTWEYSSEKTEEGYAKKIFKKYYNNGAFAMKFFDFVSNEPKFAGDRPWIQAPEIMYEFQNIFGLFKNPHTGAEVKFIQPAIMNMLDPVVGSPKGIDFFSRIVGTAIKKLESLLLATKVNKSGSEIDTNSVPSGYNYNNLLDIVVSPGDYTIREEHTFDSPNELFEAISNKNIYSDYLSIGNPLAPPGTILRSISTQYYAERCQLEAAKLSPIAKYKEGFDGNMQGSNISAPEPGEAMGFDYLKNTGYSYLAPSVVYLLDPNKQKKSYGVTYRVFKPGAKNYLENPDATAAMLHSAEFVSPEKLERLFTSFLNYSISKKDTTDADLMESFYEVGGQISGIASVREGYKRLYDKIGITFHDSVKHDTWFGEAAHKPRSPGSAPYNIPDEEEYDHLPTGLHPVEDFSDGAVYPISVMKAFLLNKDQKVISADISVPDPYKYNLYLPNNFKIKLVHQKKKESFKILHDKLTAAYEDTVGRTWSPFFFFNNDLTSRIEVFKGAPSHYLFGGADVNSKDDENAWHLLTEEDLQISGMQTLFCRINLFDERLKKDINMPIVDKYFLMHPQPKLVVKNLITAFTKTKDTTTRDTVDLGAKKTTRKTPRKLDLSGANFWERRSFDKINDMKRSVERGSSAVRPDQSRREDRQIAPMQRAGETGPTGGGYNR
tara:strand:- start:939 stop:4850 length:3912 start_codon:yes stop_codon:yes gene_type:complete